MERWAGDAAPIKSSNYVTAVRFTDSRQSSGVCVHAEQNGRSRRAAFRDGRPTCSPTPCPHAAYRSNRTDPTALKLGRHSTYDTSVR